MEPIWLINENPIQNASATVGTLVAALAKSQAEFTPIPKTRTATVSSEKDGRRTQYSYLYADLSDILAHTRPVLGANGIAVVQRLATKGDLLTVETILLKGEEWISTTLSLQFNARSFNVAQNMAGLATYLKRYAYCALVGVQAEEDTDAVEDTPPPPTRVESPALEVEGAITAAQQKKLKDGLAVSGLSLQKLLAGCVDDGETPPKRLQDIPADRMGRAEATIERALRAAEGGV